MGIFFSCCCKDEKIENHIINHGYIDKYPRIIELKNTEILLNQMKNCIWKIYLENGKKGTGFFCKIPFPDKNRLITVLITNNHVINEEYPEKILLLFNNENNERKPLSLKNRLKYTHKSYDITIIQIKEEEDEIENYLELDDNIINNITNIDINMIYVKESIYVLQFPLSNEIAGVSFGIIKSIKNYHIFHTCNTEPGSSGSAILLSNNKLIGIHKGAIDNLYYNIGSFLNYAIKDFIKEKLPKIDCLINS